MAGEQTTATLVCELVKRIQPLLKDHEPKIRAGVLADLLAMHLASYQGPDASPVREVLIQEHLVAVRRLIPVNEAIIRGDEPDSE